MTDFEFRGDILNDEYAEILRYYGYSDNVCPADIRSLIEQADGDEIALSINSDGGELIAGCEIYSLLRAYSGRKTAHVQSRSASSATVVMMACDRITSEPVSLFCIHNPSTYAHGDSYEMRHTAEELDNIKEAILSAYEPRIKKPREEISALMDRDVWIDAVKALEYGLIDEISSGEGAADIVNCRRSKPLYPSSKMIEDYRKMKSTDNSVKKSAAIAFLESYKI